VKARMFRQIFGLNIEFLLHANQTKHIYMISNFSPCPSTLFLHKNLKRGVKQKEEDNTSYDDCNQNSKNPKPKIQASPLR